jgi:type I restriction enzyme, S subunit
MRLNELLNLFDRTTAAPDAIPRLRRFILDLAVRGKLVEQDIRDEPASELLKRIQTAKERLTKETGIRQVVLPPIEPNEVPFAVPSTWVWMRVGWGFLYDAGTKRDPQELAPDRWLLELEDIEKDTSLVRTRFKVRDRDSRSTKSEFRPGDILYGKLRPYLNKVVTADEDGYSTTEIVAIRPLIPLSSSYCCLAFRRPDFVEYVSRMGQGTKMPRLRTQDALMALFPLPPVAEQHRIVGKVDELMALCDRLEDAQREREIRRGLLAAAANYHLNDSANGGAFRKRAHFYLGQFPRFTTDPAHVMQLRQSVLNLAVRGHLVTQNPEDEPASELLKSIVAENARLQRAKNIRAQKSGPPAESFEAKTLIPKTWVHAYLQDLAYQITDGTHLTPTYTDKGKPFLSAQNVKPFRFMPEKHRFVSNVDFANYRSNRKPERNDVLLTRVGAGIGEAAVLDSDFEFAFYVSLCLIKIPTRFLNPKYVVLWLNSPEGRNSSTIRTYGKGASQGNLNLGLIRTFKIPIPPLAEQNRIVAKVDELMTLCDKLEEQLSDALAESGHLLESVLYHALNDSSETSTEATSSAIRNVDTAVSAI